MQKAGYFLLHIELETNARFPLKLSTNYYATLQLT